MSFLLQIQSAPLTAQRRLAKYLGTTVQGLRTYYQFPKAAWHEAPKVEKVEWAQINTKGNL